MNIIQVIYNACLSIYNIIQERKYRVSKVKGKEVYINPNNKAGKDVSLLIGTSQAKKMARSIRKRKKKGNSVRKKDSNNNTDSGDEKSVKK
jgi:hypothetical protein